MFIIAKTKKGNYLTDHHIKPKCRGGKKTIENISKITRENHRKYHALLGNRTPKEIVKNLVEDYWNGNWGHIEEALLKHKMEEQKDRYREEGKCTWYDAVKQIVKDKGIRYSSDTQLECLVCPDGRPSIGECERYYDGRELNNNYKI